MDQVFSLLTRSICEHGSVEFITTGPVRGFAKPREKYIYIYFFGHLFFVRSCIHRNLFENRRLNKTTSNGKKKNVRDL